MTTMDAAYARQNPARVAHQRSSASIGEGAQTPGVHEPARISNHGGHYANKTGRHALLHRPPIYASTNGHPVSQRHDPSPDRPRQPPSKHTASIDH